MRIDDVNTEAIQLTPRSEKARAWIDRVYALYPQTWQHNHVMVLGGEGDDQQFAMFELEPSLSKRDAVEVKWFQAYPLRQGVGSRAMRTLQDLAQQDGITLTLYPWNKGQVSQGNLVKFYRRSGFRPTAKGAKTMAWEPSVMEAKLTNRDPVERWIAVFKASTHPKFKGKSSAEREKMARMAQYRAVQNKKTFENMDHSKDSQAVPELKAALLSRKRLIKSKSGDKDAVYDIINGLMTSIAKAHGISGQKLHDMWVDQYDEIPDTWILHEHRGVPAEAMLAKQHGVGVAKIKQLLAQGIKHELAQATDRAAAREMALEKLQHDLGHYDLLEEAANMTTAALRNRLNKLMAEDQAYADATQRAPWQEGVWRFITANKAQIFSDLGDSGNGDYPSAPFAAWLLVQHMDAHPERQAAFYKLLKSAIPNHPKLQFLRDRAAVNQWIMQHYQEPQFHRDGKPLANPTSDVRDHRLFKDAGIKAASRQEALDNAVAAGNKLLVAAVEATGAKTQPSYTQQTKESMEEAAIDTTEYGGWITPDKQIEYVDTHDHAAHVARHHNLDYNEAFLDGFLRFANHSRTNTFSVEGMLPVLRKTYRMWAPTALAADRVYVDIYKWQDHMANQGLTPHMMFRPQDGDKPQIINSFGPQSAQLSEGTKRKAKTLIDGMIKSLIKQGRTRDEAISDLKKQVDSRFYEAIDLLANGDILEENLRDWFKQKWVRFGPDGKIKGDCARGSSKEGKPKCLPQAKAHALGKKKRATAARRKRREDPNANRKGKAKNVRTKESIAENSALRSATMRVQRMLNDRFGANLDIDGILGPLTLASINQFMPAAGFGPADDPSRTTAVQGGELKTESCPHCGGVMYEASQIAEKQDACYYKVKSRYKVWPSAYASGALVQCRKKGAKNWGKHKAEEALREDEDYHSEIKMNQLIDNVTHMLDHGQAYDALETMESWDATVDSDPRLSALWDQNMDQLANMFIQELKDGSGDPHALGQIAEMIARIGIPMPNHKISAILDSKSLLINRLVSKDLRYSSLLQVVQSLGAMEHWGLHYYLEDFVDVEDDKAEVIRSLLKLYKSGRGSDVSEIIDRLRREGHEWPEFASFDKSMGAGKLTETRDAALKWLKSYLPAWPDYVVRDWMYNHFRGEWAASGDDPKTVIQRTLDGEGMTPQTRWKFVPDFHFTFDSLDPDTVRRIKERQGGTVNPYGIPKDAERHATQATLAAQQGGVRDEPVILKKVGDQYELIEGWHRTIQHFKQFPDGYKGPAWIALDAKPVNEEEQDKQITWTKPNLDFEWEEIPFQSKAAGVPNEVRQYLQQHFPDKATWLRTAQQGRVVTIPADHSLDIENSPHDEASLMHALRSDQDPGGPGKAARAEQAFRERSVEMPIILNTGDRLWLIGGKTRLGYANYILKIPAKVWMIGDNLSENFADGKGKITLYTDPNYYGAEVDDSAGKGKPVIQVPLSKLVGFEPDEKMKSAKSSANMEKMVKLIKSGKGSDLPPILVRRYEGGYQVLDGHHRYHAYTAAGAKTIPAKLIPADEIKIIDKATINENFADGKGPGRKGDSGRHGIPKHATIAQLEKAAKASGRKGQLARWQLNMRRGRAKAHESEEPMTADQWQALRKEDPRSYLGIKDYRNRKWWESHFKAAMAQARVKGEPRFEFPPGTNMWYMVTKNPLEEGSPPHGTPENELAMMKARTKPAVTFLDMGQYEEMYEPNMELYGWIKQKWRLPNMDVGYYVIGQPGQEARVKRIGQLIYDMNKNGQNPTADYHRELGRLLGYSEADINGFLKDLEQQN